MSTFSDAVEAKDLKALEAALHPDAVFRSPAVFGPYEGREATMKVLGVVMTVLQDFRYVSRIESAEGHVLRFHARVGDLDVDGVDILGFDDGGPDEGLVTELTVMIRPYKALTAVLTEVGKGLSG